MVMHKISRILILVCMLISASAAQAGTSLALRSISRRSDLLSSFWGRSIAMRSKAYVPPACKAAGARCPVLYHLPGYSGSVATAWNYLAPYVVLSANNPKLAIAHVFLDPQFNGNHYFVDSENNGPWNSATVQEFIPYIEKKLHLAGTPEKRFLVGHSSGGWGVIWLQVSNPTFFNGVWGLSPDPVDFRHFYQTNATPGSKENFYYTSSGDLKMLERGDSVSIRKYMTTIDDDPEQGGVISSYEFAWSPKGKDGLPMRFFNRKNGALISQTLKAWRDYDIHKVLAHDSQLKTLLAGKLHIYCGGIDSFYYDEPTSALCSFLSRHHYRAACEIVAGRTHGDIFNPNPLYPRGLRYLVITEALAAAAAEKTAL